MLTKLLHNWKRKFLATIILAFVICIISNLLETQNRLIASQVLFFPAFYALIWILPIGFLILFLENKIDLIPDKWIVKKHISKFYSWSPRIVVVVLSFFIYLVVTAIWLLAFQWISILLNN